MIAEAAFDLLLEIALKASLLLTAGFVVSHLTRRWGAEFTHRMWVPVFAVTLLLPLICFLPRWQVLPVTIETAAVAPPQTAAATPALELSEKTDSAANSLQATSSQESSVNPTPWNWPSALVLIWLAGIAWFTALATSAQLRLLRLLRRSRTAPPAILRIAELCWRQTATKRRAARIIVCSHLESPCAWGVIRPVIALPGSAESWSREEISIVLRHEIHHILRYDIAALWLTRLMCAVHWFNPLAWRAAARATLLREAAVDRRILDGGCEPEQYATLLLAQAHSAKQSSPTLCATSISDQRNLEQRIHMILNSSKNLSTVSASSSHRGRHAVIAGVTALALIAATVGRTVAQQENQVHTLAIREHIPVASTTEPQPSADNQIVVSTKFGPEQYLFSFDGMDVAEKDLESILGKAAGKNSTLQLSSNRPIPAKKVAAVVNLASNAGFTKVAFVASPSDDPAASLKKKLAEITLPSVQFEDTPLRSALEQLVKLSSELDIHETDPAKKGVNIVLSAGKGSSTSAISDTLITLRLKNVSLAEALNYTTRLAQLKYSVEPHNVLIEPVTRAAPSDVVEKLESIRFPAVVFKETPYKDALAFVRQKAAEMDKAELDPGRKGVNIVLVPHQAAGDAEKQSLPTVTRSFSNATLGEIIRAIASDVGDKVSIQNGTVLLHPDR